MQKFKRKSLYLALVAAVSSVGIANVATAAVHVNSNGLGQVLIYPYYTVRGGMDTYLSVINTSTSSKAVKVRFTEGKNSREVLDFNLYMSPRDMWTGAVVGTATGAKLITADVSCTSPQIPVGIGKDFVNFAYTGATYVEGIGVSGADGETTSLDRTREGYFEVIEMGVITNTAVIAAITHVSGVPANCAVVQAASMNMGTNPGWPGTFPARALGGQSTALDPSIGGLAGSASLINVASGTDFGFDPVVIDSFTSRTAAKTNDWALPGFIFPDLSAADTRSIIFQGNLAIPTVTSNWLRGTDSVAAVLMHNSIINEYVLDAATLSGTDWVVTMPTKRYGVPVRNPLALTADTTQLLSPWTQKFWLNGACELVSLEYWNREEGNVSIVGFSPLPPGGTTSLCWESTVVTFNDSHVLGAVNEVNVPVNFQNGWLQMSFSASLIAAVNGQAEANSIPTGPQALTGTNVHTTAAQSMSSLDSDAPSNTYFGLPTVGFMVHDFINQNAAPGILATYGGNFNHKYTVNVNNAN